MNLSGTVEKKGGKMNSCRGMKKLFRLIPLFALLAACQAEQEDPVQEKFPDIPQAGNEVFYGVFEDSADTKAYADENLHVLWNADDRVSIFVKNDVNREFRFSGEDGANAGEFEAVTTDGAETGNSLAYNYAVHPYSAATSISQEGLLSLTLPAEQTYREASFGRGASIMVAVSEDNMLQFKNAETFVSIKLYGRDISVSRISFKGNSGEKLAGSASVSMALNGTPSVTMAAENVSETVTLVCPEPVMIGADKEHATAFWFAIPPTRFSRGFTITVEDSAGNLYEKSTTKEIEFTRSALKRMSAFELIPRGFGLYPVSGEDYVYDPLTDQMNIYEAEGRGWFRFLRFPMTMRELGPIPLDVTEGSTFTAVLSTVANGEETGNGEYALTVHSYRNGIMRLGTEAGDRFVIRF